MPGTISYFSDRRKILKSPKFLLIPSRIFCKLKSILEDPILADKIAEAAGKIENIAGKCLRPVLQTPTEDFHALTQEINRVYPTFVWLIMETCEIFRDVVDNPKFIKTIEETLSEKKLVVDVCKGCLHRLTKSSKKKATDGILRMIAFSRTMCTLSKTSPERMAYFYETIALDLLDIWAHCYFLYLCVLEGSRKEPLPVAYATIVEIFQEDVEKCEAYIKSLENEWDVITDVVTVEAIKKNIQVWKETGTTVPGTRDMREVLNEMESQH